MRASIKFLIRDPAGQFTDSSGAAFQAASITIPASPPRAPIANALCEKIIDTLRRELLNRALTAGEHHLRRMLTEYHQHCNTARPHRAPGQLAPAHAGPQPPETNLAEHQARRRQILSRLASEYRIAA